MKKWFILRIIALILAFLGGLIGMAIEINGRNFEASDFSLLALIFSVGAIFILTMTASDRFTTRFEEDTRPWYKPSLSIKPFEKNNPLQGWFFSSLCCLSIGLGLLLRLFVAGESLTFDAFLFIAASSGIMAGCGLALLLFKKSFIKRTGG